MSGAKQTMRNIRKLSDFEDLSFSLFREPRWGAQCIMTGVAGFTSLLALVSHAGRR